MRDNLLEMTPVAVYPVSETADGNLRVEVPKFKNKFAKRICRVLKLGENISVRLDGIGSFIYSRCDGGHTVKDLVGDMKEAFGDTVEPVMPRISQFLGILEKNGLITFREHSEA
jgi:hypothetical protein